MPHALRALAEAVMRGSDEASGSLFSYADLEVRIPARHTRCKIRQVVHDVLASLNAEFEALYTDFRRPSIPVRFIGEQHVREDCGGRIPSPIEC